MGKPTFPDTELGRKQEQAYDHHCAQADEDITAYATIYNRLNALAKTVDLLNKKIDTGLSAQENTELQDQLAMFATIFDKIADSMLIRESIKNETNQANLNAHIPDGYRTYKRPKL